MTDNNQQKKKRTRKPHSEETKKRISEKRKSRIGVNDPRHAGQSKKRKSLYEELKEDYKKNPEALKWLEENKEGLGWNPNGKTKQGAEEMIALAKEWGIQTEYTEMYTRVYEQKVQEMLFTGSELDVPENDEIDPWNHVDFGED